MVRLPIYFIKLALPNLNEDSIQDKENSRQM